MDTLPLLLLLLDFCHLLLELKRFRLTVFILFIFLVLFYLVQPLRACGSFELAKDKSLFKGINVIEYYHYVHFITFFYIIYWNTSDDK